MQVVFFVVAGPSREKVREYTKSLTENFLDDSSAKE